MQKQQLSTPAYYVTYSLDNRTSPLLMSLSRINHGVASIDEGRRTARSILTKTAEELQKEGQIVPQRQHHEWHNRENNLSLRMSDTPLHMLEGDKGLTNHLEWALHGLTFRLIVGHNFDADLRGWQDLMRSTSAYLEHKEEVQLAARIRVCADMIHNLYYLGQHHGPDNDLFAPAVAWRRATLVEPRETGESHPTWNDDEKVYLEEHSGREAFGVLNDREREKIIERMRERLSVRRKPEA